jgi:hypothetical protein
MRLVGGPIIAVEAGSNIPEGHLSSNALAHAVEYTDTPPQYLTPPVVQEEIYGHIDRIEDRMYKICGVSQANATGTTEPGLKSGAAIREHQDIVSGRFEIIGQRYEEFFLEIARVIVDISNDIYKDDKSLSVLTKDKRGISRIEFKEVVDALDDFELQLFPVSGLSTSPAGRLDQLADYAAAGYISKEQVMDVVDFPDLEDLVSIETASTHLVQQILGNIKEYGIDKYISPEPFMNLPQAFQYATFEVCRSQVENVPEENVDLLRRFANECKDLMDAAASTQQPAPPQAVQQTQVSQPQQQ